MGGAEILHKLALDSASQVIGGIKGGKGLEMKIANERKLQRSKLPRN